MCLAASAQRWLWQQLGKVLSDGSTDQCGDSSLHTLQILFNMMRKHLPHSALQRPIFENISNSVFCVSTDTFCSSLAGLRPCTAQLHLATLWHPALSTLPLPGPCRGTPSHGLPLAWRNPTSTATGNVLPSVPSSSPSPWCSCWLTLLVSSLLYILIHP